LHDIAFEWDSGKAAKNWRKHGVDFETAREVFFDPFLRLGDAGSAGEERQAVIGMTAGWQFLFVVFVESGVIRLISARPATSAERRLYEDG